MTVTPLRPLGARPLGGRGAVAATTRTRIPGLDWVLLAAVAVLLVVGTLLVWSATATRASLVGDDSTAFLRRQLVNVAIGVVLAVVVVATDHRWLRIVAPLVYLVSVVGLVLVLVMGSTINGSRSWLRLGGMSIQPAEFAKLAVVVGMALLVAERAQASWRRSVGTREVVGMLAIAAVPAAIGEVFAGAFAGSSAVGGFLGSTIMVAVQYGVARGIFSNESGIGSAATRSSRGRKAAP